MIDDCRWSVGQIVPRHARCEPWRYFHTSAVGAVRFTCCLGRGALASHDFFRLKAEKLCDTRFPDPYVSRLHHEKVVTHNSSPKAHSATIRWDPRAIACARFLALARDIPGASLNMALCSKTAGRLLRRACTLNAAQFRMSRNHGREYATLKRALRDESLPLTSPWNSFLIKNV